MAVSGAVPLLAVVSAGVAGYFGYRCFEEGRRRRRFAENALSGGAGSSLARVVQNGIRPLVPLSRWVLRWEKIASLCREAVAIAEKRGLVVSQESLLSSFLGLGALAGVAASIVAGSPLFGIALCVLAVFFCANRIGSLRTAREMRLREQTPEALRALAVCSKSGLTLSQTMATLAKDLDEPLSGLFEQARRRLSVGGSSSEALAVFSQETSLAELSFVAVALDAQHQSGGSLVQVLESARESVRDELDLRRSLQVQTAQAQLSARIVACMPFVLVALFSLGTEDFMGPFFQSAQGMALLVLALGMQLAGVLCVRGLLRREGGLS